MLRTHSIAVLLLVTSSFAFGADEKNDVSALKGTWLPVSAEMSGQKVPDEVLKLIQLTIDNEKYTVIDGKATDKGKIIYDSSGKLKTMDITGEDGPNKGKTFLAIYELSGDSLTICYDLEGKERPAEFKSKEKTKLFFVTYKRKKD